MNKGRTGKSMADKLDALTFDSVETLAAWLVASGVAIADWGRGDAKTVADLWRETVLGESTLRDEPPRRELRIVQVTIRRGERVLVELEQVLRDGRRRTRDLPPGEKLKAGEGALLAARRCLLEELGLAVPLSTLYEERPPFDETEESPSYPGLLAHYTVHRVAVHTEAAAALDLPAADFWRNNNAPDDPVQRHLWGWR